MAVIVIKLGTSSICDEKSFYPKLASLSALVETVVKLRINGHQVLVVTSGAVGVGLRRMNFTERPKALSQIQATAAVGQGRLMALYDTLFGQFDVPIAQILLTRENLADRCQYKNACLTLKELLQWNVVPIINENDSVSNAEIRFGDNDTLSAIAAGMVHADYLFLLTDVDCLYTDNPRVNPDAKPVRVVQNIASLRQQVNVASSGSSIGTGGMVTKLVAAELATAAGCAMMILRGANPHLIIDAIEEIRQSNNSSFQPSIGTLFLAKPNPMNDRKWWIRYGLAPAGALYVDDGAARAIAVNKSSLFAVGITRVEGDFDALQSVRIFASTNNATAVEIAKGVVNYSSTDIRRICGKNSAQIADILGYIDTEYVVYRGNIVTSPSE